MPKLNENSFINDFIQTFVKRPEKEADTSFDAFKKSFDGYVKFDIAHDSPELRKFPIIDYNDEKWRILGGIYISNYASTIIEKNSKIISGFLLDTTFRALPSFVTAILMASIYNVGVPIAFSFSLTESEEIYQRIYDTFYQKLMIDLSKYKFESDQGKALKAFFIKNKIQNLVCNRHLLVSLKKNIFNFQIGTIVKCRCQKDFDTCIAAYSEEFNQFLFQYKEINNNKEFEKKKKRTFECFRKSWIDLY